MHRNHSLSAKKKSTEMELFGKIFVIALVLQSNLVDGTGNCGWQHKKELSTDGELIPVEISRHKYGNNVTCSMEIAYRPPSRQSRHLKVEVSSFDLEGSSATGYVCLVESERLTLQMVTDTGLESVTWCGQLYAEKHVFPTSKLTLIYNSGLIGQGKGFKLEVSLVLVNSDNGAVFKANEQPRLLYSPKFPDLYGNNVKHTMTLEGEKDYILIRILLMDLEPALHSWACLDAVIINTEKLCGNQNDPKEIIVPSNKVDVKFSSDSDTTRRGFIFEYASYDFEDFSNTTGHPEKIGREPKLFHITEERFSYDFKAEDHNDSLHMEFVGLMDDFHGSIIDQDYGLFSIKPSLKHYWTMGDMVELTVITRSKHTFVLVRSVGEGHGVGLFRAEHTVAWLRRDCDCEDKLDFKVYLPESSDDKIKVKGVFRDGTINNGPTPDYFDMVKGCGSHHSYQTEFISWNTKIVRIEFSPEEWREGVLIEYLNTDETYPRTTMSSGDYDVLNKFSDQKLRNFFCFLQVKPEGSRTAEITARSNLDAPDSVILRYKDPGRDSMVVARLADLKKQEVEFHIQEPDAVLIDVNIREPPKIAGQEPDVNINVGTRLGYLWYNVNTLYASPDILKEASAPSFLILDPSIDCIWDIEPLRSGGYTKITVSGVANPPGNGHPCADLVVQSKERGVTFYSLNICPGQYDPDAQSDDLYLSGSGTITLKRSVWIELPEPLFTYTMVTNFHGTTSVPSTHRFCPPEVTVGNGVEYYFSSSDVLPYISNYSPFKCEMRILPLYYDSAIQVDVGNFYSINEDFSITIVGYDPSDPDENPIKDIEVTAADSTTSFRHMALKVTAVIPRTGYHFNIDFRLVQETTCNENEFPLATEKFQYIVSPNYPYDFPRGLYCEWRFNQMGPIYFELVEYEGSRNCWHDSLEVIFGEYTDLKTIRYCGGVDNPIVVDDEEGSYLWQVVRIRFRSRTNTGGYKGFKLRYKLKKSSDHGYVGDNDHSSSGNKTGVAVGSSIASILFLLIIGAAVAVFVTHRRRVQHQERQRNRRDLVRNWRQQRADSSGSVTPSVFVVGSMVVNTNSPPPPYPGRPENRDSEYANLGGGYYSNPDGGYTNSAGQFSAQRRNGPQTTATGTQSEYAELEAPPPYHPLMPGSPYSSEEHFYHPLANPRDSGHPLANPRDSGIAMSNMTLYSMAQSTSSVNRNGSDDTSGTSAPAAYSLANTPQDEEGQGQVYDTARASDDRPAGPGNHGNRGSQSDEGHEEPRYEVPNNLQEETEAPPSYEDSNPPHPPPSYELATFPNTSGSENPGVRFQSRGPQARNGRLGPL